MDARSGIVSSCSSSSASASILQGRPRFSLSSCRAPPSCLGLLEAWPWQHQGGSRRERSRASDFQLVDLEEATGRIGPGCRSRVAKVRQAPPAARSKTNNPMGPAQRTTKSRKPRGFPQRLGGRPLAAAAGGTLIRTRTSSVAASGLLSLAWRHVSMLCPCRTAPENDQRAFGVEDLLGAGIEGVVALPGTSTWSSLLGGACES